MLVIRKRLGGGYTDGLRFGRPWAVWMEICCWIEFESEAHNSHNCYYLGMNPTKLFLMDMLIFLK